VEILVGACSLYSNHLVQSSTSFGVGKAFPHLFFSHYTLWRSQNEAEEAMAPLKRTPLHKRKARLGCQAPRTNVKFVLKILWIQFWFAKVFFRDGQKDFSRGGTVVKFPTPS